MNYISAINAFEKWLETNYLPVASQLLWYKLMVLFNRGGWPEWVTVDNRTLMALIQINREATFIDVRDRLIQAGFVIYQKGKKGSPNKYKLTFTGEVQIEVQTEVQSVVQTEVKTVAQTVDLYKQRHKQDVDVNNVTNIAADFQKVVQSYEGNVGTLTQVASQGIQAFLQDGLTEGLIVAAIEKAAAMGKGTWRYIEGILNNCRKSNITTAEAFARQKKPRPAGKKTGFANFSQTAEYDIDAIERLEQQRLREDAQ